MQVPERIRARLKEAGDREAQREVGIEVAREALIEVTEHPRVTGTYVFPPFGSYRAVLRVLEVVRERMG
jgi:homocysteine S-methyltransferase